MARLAVNLTYCTGGSHTRKGEFGPGVRFVVVCIASRQKGQWLLPYGGFAPAWVCSPEADTHQELQKYHPISKMHGPAL
jgi:hypothetical protein